ncbi:MAG TPA: 50S ribosomal protein L4, partial [Anaerolineae bacterium]|nr:50S ribosomal protein L4 [Anaerolineae bacterium]
SALSVKAADQQIVVLDKLEFESSKTKEMSAVLNNIEAGRSTLVLLPESNDQVEQATRNLDGVTYLRANYLNIRDLLGHDTILMPRGALDVIENLLG